MADDTVLVIEGENKRIDTEDDAARIIDQIKQSTGLTSLKLSSNSYGPEAAACIGQALGTSVGTTLRHALWSDMFVSRLKTEIPPALTSLGNGLIAAGTRLVELDLSDNAFGPTGVEGVTTLLTSEVCYSLKILKFNNNGLGIGGGKILSQALLSCHQQANENGSRFALEVFESGRNRLENAGAQALAEVFEAIGTLVELSLPQNGIYHEGISALANALSKNTNLKVLNLSDNTFSEEGSAAMAQVIPSLQQLEIINFGECLVRSKGAVAIATAIKDGHPMLKELRLSYNELDVNAGSAVIESLCNKQELALLDLNGNNFGEAGIERLQEMMTASGQEDTLQSFSDDEGDSEGEEEEEEEENDDISQRENERDNNNTIELSYNDDDNNKENSNDIQVNGVKVTLNDWLESPSKNSFINLGDDRISLLQEHLTSNPSIHMLADVYTKVAIGYQTPPLTGSGQLNLSKYHNAVHEFIDKCCEPVLSDREDNLILFINELLSIIGLIKNEDKTFRPFPFFKGPLLVTAEYLSKQSYFSSKCRDILITFFAKPCSLVNFTELRPVLLSVLHS